MTQTTETCELCGKRRRSTQSHGSLTQWLFDDNCCSCGITPLIPDEKPVTALCAKCGKSLSKGRDGSMTQWIFRLDSCNCKRDPFSIKPPAETSPEPNEPAIEEEELPIDSKNFPLERYKPLAELGQGATGKIFLARDRILAKKVSVKTLRNLTDEQLVAFQKEARALSKLSHPNIVSLLDFGPTESGTPYMVLEFFEGITLSQFVSENGTLSIPLFKRIFLQICSALSMAHKMGIFHRDVKPANILIGTDAETEVKLIDFGIAQLQDHQVDLASHKQGSTIAGTPSYMSPDTAAGRNYDARSEVYSLGCTFFEVLTGRLPFLADTAIGTINLHATAESPRLSDVSDREFSDAIEVLVSRCLTKDPDDRYQSINDLADAIASIDSEPNDEEEEEEESTETAVMAPRPTVAINSTPIIIIVVLIGLGSLALVITFAANQNTAAPPVELKSYGENFAPMDTQVSKTEIEEKGSIDDERKHVDDSRIIPRMLGDKKNEATEQLVKRLASLRSQAWHQQSKGSPDEAEKIWLTALKESKALYGPSEIEYRKLLRDMGNFFEQFKRYEPGAKLYFDDMKNYEAAQQIASGGQATVDPEDALNLSEDQERYARFRELLGDDKAALAYRKQALILRDYCRIADVETAALLTALGVSYHKAKDFKKAQQQFERADKMLATLQPPNQKLKFEVLSGLAALSKYGERNFADAEMHYQKLYDFEKSTLIATADQHLSVLVELASAQESLGKFKRARTTAEEAIKYGETHEIGNIALRCYPLLTLGRCLEKRNQYADAERVYQKLEDIGLKNPDTQVSWYGQGLLWKAGAQACQRKPEAKETFEHAIAVAKKAGDTNTLAQALMMFAEYHQCNLERKEAEPLYQQALAVAQSPNAPKSLLPTVYQRIGDSLSLTGQYEKAEEYFKKALASRVVHGERSRAIQGDIRVSIANMETYRGNFAEAERCYQQASVAQKVPRPDEADFREHLYMSWAISHWLAGKQAEANSYFTKSQDWQKKTNGKLKDRSLDSINRKNRYYVPSAAWNIELTKSNCLTLLTNMKNELGAHDRAYVATIKRISEIFKRKNPDDAGFFKDLADQERSKI